MRRDRGGGVGGDRGGSVPAVAVWLGSPVLSAPLAGGGGEGRGKAQAGTLRRARRDVVAIRLSSPSRDAARTEVLAGRLQKGDKVNICGFGPFALSARKARQGRNPKTGETIEIPASKSAKFKAGKSLKGKLN